MLTIICLGDSLRLANQIHENEQQLAREREVVTILTTPGARMAELSGTNIAPSAHAMLAYDKSGRAVLVAKGLLFSVIVGLAGSFLPALRAARLPVIAALKAV